MEMAYRVAPANFPSAIGSRVGRRAGAKCPGGCGWAGGWVWPGLVIWLRGRRGAGMLGAGCPFP